MTDPGRRKAKKTDSISHGVCDTRSREAIRPLLVGGEAENRFPDRLSMLGGNRRFIGIGPGACGERDTQAPPVTGGSPARLCA